MKFLILIGTTIGDHNDPVISVAGLQQGREHDAAGCDAEQYNRLNFFRPKEHLQIRSGKRTHAMFGHQDVIRLRPKGRVDSS